MDKHFTDCETELQDLMQYNRWRASQAGETHDHYGYLLQDPEVEEERWNVTFRIDEYRGVGEMYP